MNTNIKKAILFTAILISFVALLSCRKPEISLTGEIGKEPLVLKSYDVPASYGSEAERVINKLLLASSADKALGRAELTTDGQLLVTAPKSMQPGVESFIEKLKMRGPLQPEPAIQVQYWIVFGRKTNGFSNADQFKEIAPALKAINESQNPYEFFVREHLSTLSQSGMRSEVEGVVTRVYATNTIRGDSVIMELNARIEGSNFMTNVQIPKAKLLILGQMAHKIEWAHDLFEKFGGKIIGNKAQPVFADVFLIVRADVIS